MSSLVLIGAKWINNIFNSLWLMICDTIYSFISLLYQVFEKVASVNLFNQEIFDKITGRLYIVIAIAMLFIFAYNIILAIVNPDGKDKGMGGLGKSVKETIISLVLIVLLPTIFNWLYVFQTHVLESNIIGTVILGGAGSTSGYADLNGDGVIDTNDCEEGDYDCTCDFSAYKFSDQNVETQLENACKNYRDNMPASQRGAYSIAPTIFSTFYRPANFTFTDCVNYMTGADTTLITDKQDIQICRNYFVWVVYGKYTGSIKSLTKDAYLKNILNDDDNSSFEFDWVMAIIAGVLAIYMFFCYAMEVGVRVAKLGFLQLISPIPVMMRIIPGQKEKMFDKWFNHIKNAYLDVFIRLIIIYFTLFAVSLVPDVISTMWNSIWDGSSVASGTFGGVTNFLVKMLVTVFVILGLLKFAQEAPGLLKEFFSGGGGSFALRSPAKQLKDNKLAMGGIGAVAGGAQNMLGNYYRATHDAEGKKIDKSMGRGLKSAAGGLIGGARRGAVRGYRTNDLRNLGGELKQAKYETDEARARREANKQYAAEHGYSGPMSGLYGSVLQTKQGLETYIKTDGSGKVTANSAQNISKRFKDIDEKYSSAELKRIKNRLAGDSDVIRKPNEGQSFFVGNDCYTFNNGEWSKGGVVISREKLEDINKKYVHNEELREKASIYTKRRDEFCVELDNAMTYFTNNASNLPYNDLTKIIESLKTDLKVEQGGITYQLPDSINSVDDLKSKMNEWAKSGNSGELMLVAELTDVLNKKMGSLSGTITGRTKTADIKDKK